MNVLSCFDGISAGQLALQRAGINVVNYYASEIEEPAIEITMRNFPNTVQLGDINNLLGADGLATDELKSLPKIDLVLGGSPCQGFSRNGKGFNFDDPRSKLFFTFIIILNWIRENNNPDVEFLLENVEMKKEWEKVIDEYIGVKAIKINSTLLSAQKRPRLYWTNIKNVNQPDDKGILLRDILELNVSKNYDVKEELLKSKPIEIGDKTVLQFAYRFNGEIYIRNATKQGYLIAEDGDSINLSLPNSQTRRGRVGKGKSNTLDTQCNQAVVDKGRIRRFTILELERLQTLPDGYTEGIAEAKRKKAIGNGWTVDVISYILSHMK